jgi:hypothetical protein
VLKLDRGERIGPEMTITFESPLVTLGGFGGGEDAAVRGGADEGLLGVGAVGTWRSWSGWGYCGPERRSRLWSQWLRGLTCGLVFKSVAELETYIPTLCGETVMNGAPGWSEWGAADAGGDQSGAWTGEDCRAGGQEV